MTQVNVHDYVREVSCFYDDEYYLVRDNGAVLRQPRAGKRLRQSDDVWTFGIPNRQNGYMYISRVRIHRIVATAFQGEPPTPEHVVDHIDTNRRNNRPENLRWLTRFENALLNPITVKRIEFICGSVEAFLEDPSRLSKGSFEPNFEWMRTVSPAEARASLQRLHLWAKSDLPSSARGSLGEWLFRPYLPKALPKTLRPPQHMKQAAASPREPIIPPEPLNLVMAKTLGATQRNWRTPSEFPGCPKGDQSQPIQAYAANVKPGAVFSRNDYSTHTVLEASVSEDGLTLYVMSESDGLKPWSLAKVNFEDGLYVHENRGSFFAREGAEKQFCFIRGQEWHGVDSIDDYC